eukprot:CAMPEP_0168609874 /NCGR_PEP_ID=MMETSP0449_2-20121227/1457_1 /TAXON_ID=1082188 /ORGANISM="Strombidium rassoulzadegani, Strain ras09" /LENGTH=99 /DNA_ID=CAMNT_0008650083 /DNA_START=11 /DNA_END=307 /DNA_ORIENTATION=+
MDYTGDFGAELMPTLTQLLHVQDFHGAEGTNQLLVKMSVPEPDNSGEYETYGGDNLLTILVMILAYAVLMVLGIFAYPPFIFCLTMSGGNLSSCSFNIW